MNRLLFDRNGLHDDGLLHVNAQQAKHILRVLRLSPGDTIRVGMQGGPRGIGRIENATDDAVVLRCTMDETPPPPPRIDLLLAMPRPKVMKRLWAPLASLGLGRIVIVNAAKVERYYFDTQWLSPDVIEPRLREGLEQSGDTHMPLVSVERRLKPFMEDRLDDLFPDSLRFLCHPDDGAPWSNRLRTPDTRVLIAVGPEGGWSDYELALFDTHEFAPLSLGWRSLRTDTACIALIAVVAEALRQPHTETPS